MNDIELSPDKNWYWIASIVVGAIDDEREDNALQSPLLDVNADCSPFTGEYNLQINQGGLQNRKMPKQGKVIFKEEVLPYLMQSIGTKSPITGKLELHLAQGAVKKAVLHYN